MTRVDDLTDRLFDGVLTPAEWAELETLLAVDPAAGASHVALLELEGVLRGLRTGFDLSSPTLDRIQDAQAKKTAQVVMAEIARQPAPAWSSSEKRETGPVSRTTVHFRWRAVVAGLAAVAAALTIGIWLGGQPSDSPTGGPAPQPTAPEQLADARPPAARLTNSTGAVELLTPQGDVVAVAEGRDVPPGHTLRTIGEDSVARVEMPDRTLVDIAPDTVVRFVAMGTATTKPRLFLAGGQLTAAVPDSLADPQLVVGTGVAEVFARTGTFVVSSAGPESARVDVRKGKVDVVRMDARTRIPVASGAFVQAGFEKVLVEPATHIDRTPARTLVFPNARDVVYSRDGAEVWVVSPRQVTRWTRDGGTANLSFPPHKGESNTAVAAFTRDKATMVTSTIIAKDERVHLRAMPDGEIVSEFSQKLSESRFWCASPSASWFAAVEGKPNQRRLRAFDGLTGAERWAREFDEVVGCVAAAPDGESLAVALADASRGGSRTVLLDPRTGSRIGGLPTQRKGCTAMAYAASGEHIAIGFNGHVQLWDVKNRELLRTITGYERVTTCLAFSPDGRILAAGTQDGQVWLWATATGKVVQVLDAGGRVRSLAFHPAGRRLAAVANNAPVTLWDVAEVSAEVQ